ncbi:hypothetical protein Salat_1175600 [Sesamum alatum]|uniref:Myb/SANT-like domain-containing protein n=1 Tax=Sesamum alatum TaxID=300844 RepID=A0AAE1YET8_9LAMI|nr:hypothetical protein Salat_1175600 [Sesamum alatum]
MWPDGYWYQCQFFYNSRWTREMEKTFVDALIEHARMGQFRVGCENRHAINCALRDVNKTHDTKVTYPLACSRVTKLHERLTVFMWVINRPNVVWNQNLRFVTAVDSVWREICREKKLARYYVNAYEDLLEELCMLFGVPVENEEAPPVEPPAEDAPLVAFGADAQPLEGWVDPAPVAIEGAPVIQSVVHVISDSSDSSSSL